MKYSYEYQYMTNYDIDELITPRKIANNLITNPKLLDKCKIDEDNKLDPKLNTKNYIIYEHVQDLTKKYGNYVKLFDFYLLN